jgi:hypothetical protein
MPVLRERCRLFVCADFVQQREYEILMRRCLALTALAYTYLTRCIVVTWLLPCT